ncbi:MAG: CDP-archaeol synthase [Planctomycetota bacterium]
MYPTLKKRLIISFNLITFIAFLLVFDWFFKGVSGFYLILALFSSLCFYEFAKLYWNINIKLPWHFPVITGLCGIAIIWIFWTFPKLIGFSKYAAYLQLIMWEMPMLLTFALFIVIAILYYLKHINDFSQILILFFGFVYVYLPIWSLARLMAKGIYIVLYFIAMVKIADSLAYFWGTRFGKHKLAEKVSPNKTVEGFIAGLLGAALLGMIAFYLLPVRALNLPVSIPFWLIFIVNLVIVFVSQLGDLFESYIKRFCNAKDSGNILGPMGGILDLSDSLLLAAPVAAFLLLKLY